MTPGQFSEDQLVEQPTIELLDSLGWATLNAYQETLGPDGTLGRETQGEVILTRQLRKALNKLNPDFPAEAIEQAVAKIAKDRSALDPVRANREIYDLVKDGVEVGVRTDDGGLEPERVRVIDWRHPGRNDFLLVSQFWVTGDMYRRRADLVGFVNGLPLVFIELKASHHRLENAFDDNLSDYRATIPRMFLANAVVILSNGVQSKLGTVSSKWEHFAEWKKIDDESEPGGVSLETMLRATCGRDRLLDIVENFTVFQERPGGLIKLVARNHQYLGVKSAIERLREVQESPEQRGRLGVFWHTQGSGKTLSMLFFSQKVLRSMTGNWTFVVVTDRKALDDQVYEEFSDAGVLTEGHVQATSGAHLKTLLGEEHRYVFTLIQKFKTDLGATYPVVSDRSDIIVITDEAHRSQYDVLALNMRNALPNASFLGFTGTPLIAGEEKTREVFGDYVSVYDFGESIRDGATVPLYYENRIPELQLANDAFSDELAGILEEAELDEGEESKLSRLFSQQYQLITREERLERVAADLVDHYLGRGFAGKAMVVSIDKATAVKMHDKVQAHWLRRLAENKSRLTDAGLPAGVRELLQQEIDHMEGTDMAVVVSQGQNEISTLAKRGLDITPHRRRMVEEGLETKFKDAVDPLRVVFVCAMWTTGFDVPSCSTIYLDKPIKNHTLMQTIARANRVFPEKTNGLIVDYVGVFRRLEAALAIYAQPSKSGDDLPVKDKEELLAWLGTATTNARAYCAAQGVDLDDILGRNGFQLVQAGEEAVERLIADDDTKAQFLAHAKLVNRLFKAILPDPKANEFGQIRAVLVWLSERIASLNPAVDVSDVLGRVEELLDRSVAANAYVIHAPTDGESDHRIDLNQIDWEELGRRFEQGKKRTEAERLRAEVAAKVNAMVALNPSRTDWTEKFQRLIDDYNAGSLNVEEFFQRLVDFTKSLNEEDRRGLVENLNEEQLAVYDLLMRPAPALTEDEVRQVKAIAVSLLELLRQEKLVLDWRKEQRARAAVRLAVEESLDSLPEKYTAQLFNAKCDQVFKHVFDCYWDDGRSVFDGIPLSTAVRAFEK